MAAVYREKCIAVGFGGLGVLGSSTELLIRFYWKFIKIKKLLEEPCLLRSIYLRGRQRREAQSSRYSDTLENLTRIIIS